MHKLFFEFRHLIIRLWEILYTPRDLKSSTKCDFWLVCHSKDWPIARLTIASIKKFSLNPIGKIYLVSDKLKAPVWSNKGITYIYELKIPGITSVFRKMKELSYRGWILQQILKYSGYRYSKKFVVIDCDTVLLKPHLFFTDAGCPILRISYEYSPFYQKLERAIGIYFKSFVSFTAHMMPYESRHIKNLIKQIERKNKLDWINFFTDFSIANGMIMNEQEIYAKFLLSKKIDVKFRPWFNKSLNRDVVMSIEELMLSYPKRNSVSLHKPLCNRWVLGMPISK